MSNLYRILFFIWVVSFLSYLSYLGYQFYEVEKEATRVEALGKAEAKDAAVLYETKAIPNTFETEGQIKDTLTEYATSYYLAIPKTLRDTFYMAGWKMILTDKDLSKTYYNGPVEGRLAGLTVYDKKTIYIHASRSDIRRSLIHEFGHFVDYHCGGISYSDSFHQTFQSEKHLLNEKWKIDSHATSNAQEYFAESFSQFLIYPSESKEQTPKTYATFDDIMAAFLE